MEKRDYDKEPIIIKSKRQIFTYIILFIFLFFINIYGFFKANLSFSQITHNTFFISSTVAWIVLFVMFCKSILSYKNGKTIYKFMNNEISYLAYDQEFIKNSNDISKINHILFTFHIFGKDCYRDKTIPQLLFKTDILELCFYLLGFILTIIYNILFVFPQKIIFGNFCKNFIIYFFDGSFLCIFINNRNEYDEILKYFELKKLKIDKKLKFIQTNHEEDMFAKLKNFKF
ncbi:hypothetical protein OFO12_07165 [Campylobacter sp. JMF_04 NA10]|uniref:hypothetical protein n=1 Tax=Campylobacter sp. JMF_04 NA10 TaxID=2983824 RepID=UPI0022E9E37A|nr:hypothetical protein [Campylobacter sp. JMF_04 NA10]MDA3077135.1 hypothetical protein [Campylobacter sp. JMF_04 NA10]